MFLELRLLFFQTYLNEISECRAGTKDERSDTATHRGKKLEKDLQRRK